MSKATGILIFCVGTIAGAAGAWVLLKKRFEELAREEIESVKEVYRAKADADIPEEKSEELMDYYKTIKNNKYDGEIAVESAEKSPSAAHVISPDEYGELDYEQISLNYWADEVLTDENDEVINNPVEILGDKALDSFGEYEDDAVYVRNDEFRADYEVLLDKRTFSEYCTKAHPRRKLG